jgi:hypothetical protein
MSAAGLSDARKSCLKKYKEMKTLHDKIVSKTHGAKMWRDRSRYEAKKKKAQEAAQKQFAKTEKMELAYKTEQEKYRHNWLPTTLQRMHQIELDRLALQKKSLDKYTKLRVDLLDGNLVLFANFSAPLLRLFVFRNVSLADPADGMATCGIILRNCFARTTP